MELIPVVIVERWEIVAWSCHSIYWTGLWMLRFKDAATSGERGRGLDLLVDDLPTWFLRVVGSTPEGELAVMQGCHRKASVMLGCFLARVHPSCVALRVARRSQVGAHLSQTESRCWWRQTSHFMPLVSVGKRGAY